MLAPSQAPVPGGMPSAGSCGAAAARRPHSRHSRQAGRAQARAPAAPHPALVLLPRLPFHGPASAAAGAAMPVPAARLSSSMPTLDIVAPALTTVTRLIASPQAALLLRAWAGGRATLHAETGQWGPPVAPVRRARLAAGRGALASRTGCSSCGAARPWAGAVAGVAAAAAARARALAITRT